MHKERNPKHFPQVWLAHLAGAQEQVTTRKSKIKSEATDPGKEGQSNPWAHSKGLVCAALPHTFCPEESPGLWECASQWVGGWGDREGTGTGEEGQRKALGSQGGEHSVV